MRYAVEGLPARGMSAFTPTLTRPGMVATRGLTHVAGFPGTEAVAVEKPRLPTPSWTPKTNRSNDAPTAIAPDVYLASAVNMGPWARAGAMATVTGTNELPVGGAGWTTVPGNAFRAARIGGRSVAPWPRVGQSWPSAVPGVPA